MYLGERTIGETLPFYAQCQDTAGSAINSSTDDLDYDIYANENAAAIATGTMTHLDAGALGNYSESIVLTDPPFAADTWYEIRMYPSGNIDGETPAAIHCFHIVAATPTPGDIADAVWQEAKAGHQGAAIMGNIAEDTDNLQATVREG